MLEHLSLAAKIRNARQLERPLVQYRLRHRLEPVIRTLLPIPLRNVRSRVLRIRPMRRAEPILKCLLLPHQILLTRVGNWHVAGVYAEPRRLTLGAQIIMRGAGVPEEEIAWFRADLDPLAVAVREPFHACLGEPVPFGRPGGDALLSANYRVTVEFVGEKMRAAADDQTAVVGAVWEEVDESLEAAKVGLVGVLVLVWPGFVWWKVGAAGWTPVSIEFCGLRSFRGILWEAKVDCVEGDDEVFIIVDFLESLDDAGLAADVPDELLVGNAVVHAHTFLVDEGKTVFVDRRRVIAVVAKVAVSSVVLVNAGTRRLTSPPAMSASRRHI